ncbi:MAG TPA: hypothetical protein VMT87_10595 [Vicinamibacteria bacterium]|nr:hypothetical protein [Vicinamibacteria bacterium]
MSEYLRLSRLYLVLLAIFTIGRWVTGARGVPYETGRDWFSIVIMTAMACFFYAAFTRRWRGYKLFPAVGLAMVLGLMSQLVIFAATALSYALGMDTYFTHPTALNVEAPLPAGEALARRLMGLVGNTISSGIVGGLGWALGGLLPEK